VRLQHLCSEGLLSCTLLLPLLTSHPQGLFGSVMGVLTVFGGEKAVFQREYTSRLYSMTSYFLSRCERGARVHTLHGRDRVCCMGVTGCCMGMTGCVTWA
jgi:hypothetical protein